MKKTISIFILSAFTFLSVKAQDSTVKIESKKVFGSYLYLQNDKYLSNKQLLSLMNNNNEAYQLIKSANKSKTWATILGGVGGSFIGFPIGTAIGGGDPKWELAGAGVALILIAIPINNNYNRKSKKAIDLYNSGFSSTAYKFHPTFDLNLKGNSIGLTMTF